MYDTEYHKRLNSKVLHAWPLKEKSCLSNELVISIITAL